MSRSFTVAFVATFAAAAIHPAAAQTQHFTLSGNEVSVYDLVGTINVVSGTGPSVTADVEFTGADASKLHAESGETHGRDAVRVIFPDHDIRSPDGSRGSGTDEVRLNGDGTFGGNDHEFFGSHRVRIGSGGLDAAATVTLRVPAGKKVWIYIAAGKALVNGVSADITADLWSSTLDVTNLTGALDVDGGSGDIAMTGVKGDVNLDLGSGAARVHNVTGATLAVDGGSGSVTGSGVSVHELKLDVGSGDTRLEAVKTDDLNVDSGSGDVDISLTADANDVIVDSGSGSVTIRVPTSFGARLTVDSGSGGFDSELPITIMRRHGSEIEGSIGDGKGEMRIDSGSGAVRIMKS